MIKSYAWVLILLFVLSAGPVSGATDTTVNVEWSDDIEVEARYQWQAASAELRDLRNSEKYKFGIGGRNVPGGQISVGAYNLFQVFDYFNESLLATWVTLEGDMAIYLPSLDEVNFNTINTYREDFEYNLLVLPVKADGRSFFDLLLSNTGFMENITATTFVAKSIDQEFAIYEGRYQGTHDTRYVWNVTSGLLIEKLVTSESGKKLHVVPGAGCVFFAGCPESLQSSTPDPITVTSTVTAAPPSSTEDTLPILGVGSFVLLAIIFTRNRRF